MVKEVIKHLAPRSLGCGAKPSPSNPAACRPPNGADVDEEKEEVGADEGEAHAPSSAPPSPTPRGCQNSAQVRTVRLSDVTSRPASLYSSARRTTTVGSFSISPPRRILSSSVVGSSVVEATKEKFKNNSLREEPPVRTFFGFDEAFPV